MSVNDEQASFLHPLMALRLPLLFICALLAGAASAAELGEPRVASYIKQPLVADIELTMLEDAATPVQVRLASPNVYHGANIAMPPVLSTLNFSVMRRDGRQFLHITSLKPVESAHLHLYLELGDGAQRSVRLATLWLSPDPQPAPPPAPVMPVMPVAVPVAAPAMAKPAPAKAASMEPVPTPKPAPVPSRPKPLVVAAPPKPARPAPPKPEPAPTPAPVACVPQVRPEHNACAALGAKNARLHEQLGQLEGKVQLLQAAMAAAPAAAVPAARPYKLKKKKAEPPPAADTPWLLVGGAIAGLLALLAGVLVLARRKRASKRKPVPRHVEPAVPLGARLKARLGGLGKQPKAGAAPVSAAHESSTQA